MMLWKKAKVPVQKKSNCLKKLSKLYELFRNVQKNQGKAFNAARENNFMKKTICLFDIACTDVLETISDGKKKFYLNHKFETIKSSIMEVTSEGIFI